MSIERDTYPHNHVADSAIICGSAPCLLNEFKEAKQHRPDAIVIAVNEAASGVFADKLMTLHPGQIKYFKALSLNKNIETHTAKSLASANGYEEEIDYWWSDCHSGATSAGSAIRICHKMGFKEIILVGCPMNGGDGYFNAGKTGRGLPGAPKRFGYLPKNYGLIKAHKANLEKMATAYPEITAKTFSLSGYSRDIFGGPPWQQTLTSVQNH